MLLLSLSSRACHRSPLASETVRNKKHSQAVTGGENHVAACTVHTNYRTPKLANNELIHAYYRRLLSA